MSCCSGRRKRLDWGMAPWCMYAMTLKLLELVRAENGGFDKFHGCHGDPGMAISQPTEVFDASAAALAATGAIAARCPHESNCNHDKKGRFGSAYNVNLFLPVAPSFFLLGACAMLRVAPGSFLRGCTIDNWSPCSDHSADLQRSRSCLRRPGRSPEWEDRRGLPW